MAVRAKFVVTEIRRYTGIIPTVDADGKTEWQQGEVRTVLMRPVFGGGDPNHENAKFWHASPAGQLELGCANLNVVQYFELGHEYYLDFTRAE